MENTGMQQFSSGVEPMKDAKSGENSKSGHNHRHN